MQSKQLQSASVSFQSVQLSNFASEPISAPLSSHSSQNKQLTIQSIELISEKKLSQMSEYIEKKIFKNLLNKVDEHLVKSLKSRHIIQSNEQFDSKGFLQQMTDTIQTNADNLDIWINYNIINRAEIVEFKKRILQSQKRKQEKYAQINQMIQKISQKHKDKKVQSLVDQFTKYQKESNTKFESNQSINIYAEKIKRATQRKPDSSELQFEKVEQKIKEYRDKMQKESGISFSFMDDLAI